MLAKKTLGKLSSELVERKRRKKPDFQICFQKKAGSPGGESGIFDSLNIAGDISSRDKSL